MLKSICRHCALYSCALVLAGAMHPERSDSASQLVFQCRSRGLPVSKHHKLTCLIIMSALKLKMLFMKNVIDIAVRNCG